MKIILKIALATILAIVSVIVYFWALTLAFDGVSKPISNWEIIGEVLYITSCTLLETFFIIHFFRFVDTNLNKK